MSAESPVAPSLRAGGIAIWLRPVAVASTLRRLRPVILPVTTAALFVVLWQTVVVAFHVPPVILPPPSDIAGELVYAFPLLLHHALPTTFDSLMAFAAATLLGIGLATGISYSPLLRDAIYPNLVVFQLVPKIALAPLFVVWLGISSGSRVTFATFVRFYPVVISAAVGFAGTEAATLRMCRSLTMSEWQVFRLVRFPFALPAIFSGLKIAMTMSIIGVIIGEFISAKAGLGFYILYASSRMETGLIFAALFVLCVIGVGLFGAVALAEMLVRRSYGRR